MPARCARAHAVSAHAIAVAVVRAAPLLTGFTFPTRLTAALAASCTHAATITAGWASDDIAPLATPAAVACALAGSAFTVLAAVVGARVFFARETGPASSTHTRAADTVPVASSGMAAERRFFTVSRASVDDAVGRLPSNVASTQSGMTR